MGITARKGIDIAIQVVAGLAVVCNLLVLVVFAANKRVRIKYYGFVISLAISDIVISSLLIIYINHLSTFALALIGTSLFVGELNVLAVAVNRLMALSITPPSRYDSMVTFGRLVIVCVMMWVVSALIYFPTTYSRTVFVLHFVRPLIALVIIVLTAILYLMVFRKIALYRPPLASAPGVSKADEVTCTRVRQTRHLMVTFTVILLTSFVCWTPFYIGNFLIFFSKSQSPHDQSETVIFYQVSSVLVLVLNSVINPFIYWWRFGEFRQGLYRIVSCCRQQTADADGESVNVETVVESTM